MSFFRKLKLLFLTRYLTRRLIARFIIQEIVGKDFETVIDIGAGAMPYKKIIKCKKYFGIDIEKRADEAIIGSAIKLPLVDEIANLAIMSERSATAPPRI